MKDHCTLQLHVDGRWHDVATVRLQDQPALGWRTPVVLAYDTSWAGLHLRRRDARALSATCPVGLALRRYAHWPAFLVDQLPQGFGRTELLRQLGLPETAAESGDWALLLAGAGNPVGNLRVKEAAEWLAERTPPLLGFTEEQVAARSEPFVEYLAQHGLFVAGSSGIQGEWPKLLLTLAEDGLLYLDHALPDARARSHYIVKFQRGENAALARILRHEALWMTLADRLGVAVHAPLALHERALFIPRFDRRLEGARVRRLAQESLASLMEAPGFGAAPGHEAACAALLQHSSRPAEDLLEYLKRDVANLALGNKDNHARNTALQRDKSGIVHLAPMFDFAPMYLHPDGLARRMRWADDRGGEPDWAQVLDAVLALDTAGVTRREILLAGLQDMVDPLQAIARDNPGMDADLHAWLRPRLWSLADALENLR